MKFCLRTQMSLIVLAALAQIHAAESFVPESSLVSVVLVSCIQDGTATRKTGTYIRRENNKFFVVVGSSAAKNDIISRDTFEVTFISGTKEEFSAKATVASFAEDLGVTILSGEIPKGVALTQAPAFSKLKLRETDSLVQLGFPASDRQLTIAPHPATSMNTVKVSSVRSGTNDQKSVLQIDGTGNAGQLGGPLLDSQGALAGVTLARLPNSYIGLALPAEKIEEILAGRLSGLAFQEFSKDARKFKLRATVRVQDPLGRVTRAVVNFYLKQSKKQEPEASLELRLDSDTGRGEIELAGSSFDYLVRPQTFTGLKESKIDTACELSSICKTTTPQKPANDADWLDGDVALKTRDIPKRQASESAREANLSLLESTFTVVDAKATRLRLEATRVLPCMRFSSDGSSLYTLEMDGLVRRIAVPEFIVQRELNIGGLCSEMDFSKEGLVVASPALGQVWLLDNQTLNVKAKIDAPGVVQLTSAPTLSYAFCAAGKREIVPLDLIRGLPGTPMQIGAISKLKDGRSVEAQFTSMRVTPDGRSLLVCNERTIRFDVDGEKLKLACAGPPMASELVRSELVISPDSKMLMVLGKFTRDCVPFYKMEDLKSMGKELKDDTFLAGAWDTNGAIYARSKDKDLLTFDKDLVKGKSYSFPGLRGPRQILTFPSCKKLLLLGEKLYWIELP